MCVSACHLRLCVCVCVCVCAGKVGVFLCMCLCFQAQVDQFAAAVRADPKLADGFNVVGLSQGGLIVRAYVEQYNDPPVYNLVSICGVQVCGCVCVCVCVCVWIRV
ncbi:MAG: hypothetical protein P4L40_03190 [Terracidiphilus sp.]|nr:hypothetical protein [Terracidiphilus sp.]